MLVGSLRSCDESGGLDADVLAIAVYDVHQKPSLRCRKGPELTYPLVRRSG
jgi:hypothetical protein